MLDSNLKLAVQREPAESGLACVCMLLNHYGCVATLESLRILFPVRKRGPTVAGLASVLEDLGFIAQAFGAETDELSLIATPAILLWDDARFVVMERCADGSLTVFDPVGEISAMPLTVAARHFSGVLLSVEAPIPLTSASAKLAPLPVSYPAFWLIDPPMGAVPASIDYVEDAGPLYLLPESQAEPAHPRASLDSTAQRPDDPCAIHRHLFSGIYREPGRFREVNLTRWRRRYLPFEDIADCYAQLWSMLEAEHFLTRLDRAGFIDRLTLYYSDFMALHPFIDGNGRTFQHFFAHCATLRGESLRFSQLSRSELSAAFYRSQNGDSGFLKTMLRKAHRKS